jgi:hypothetical protein
MSVVGIFEASSKHHLLSEVLHAEPLDHDLHVDPLLRLERVQLANGLRVEGCGLLKQLGLE